MTNTRFVTLSGCSGGGKSTLLEELKRRGYGAVPEPGRRIVQAELANGGSALPWIDLAAFARRAMTQAKEDWKRAAQQRGTVFFDRGLVDAAVALETATGAPAMANLNGYAPDLVFLAPPWPEIFQADAERKHSFRTSIAEFEQLSRIYRQISDRVLLLPKISVHERADFILRHLQQTSPQ